MAAHLAPKSVYFEEIPACAGMTVRIKIQKTGSVYYVFSNKISNIRAIL
ncbi:MAG: hypothetical protein OXJ52_03380 [Oligoflexia bacterium]|nr:hypothetical protein [Oligoflexia bacterium]